MSSTLLLSRSDVRELLDLRALIPVVRDALAVIGGAESDAAASQLRWPGGSLHLKAGWLAAAGIATVKANVRPDRGGASGVIVVLDPAPPGLRAVMDSADLTAVRTAAMAGVAADLLAPRGTSLSVALLGAGPVGRQSLEAVGAVRPLASVRLWSRRSEVARVAADEASMAATVATEPEEAVDGADLVITATPSRTPILVPGWLRPTATVLALGADTVGKREIGGPLPLGTMVVVDDREGAAAVGECAWLPGRAAGTASLTDLLTGGAKLPAERSLTLFDCVGTAIVDVAAIGYVLSEAERLGAGRAVHLTL